MSKRSLRSYALNAILLIGPGLTVDAQPAGAVSQPTLCDDLVFHGEKQAVVKFEFDFMAPGNWPNGCVQHVRAEPGTTLSVAIKNANKFKYRVESGSEDQKTKPEVVPDALKSILPILESSAKASPALATDTAAAISRIGAAASRRGAAFAPLARSASGPSVLMAVESLQDSQEKTDFVAANLADLQAVQLGEFESTAARLSNVAKALEKASKVKAEAVSYGELVSSEKLHLFRSGFAALANCASVLPQDDCAKAVRDLTGFIKDEVESLRSHLELIDLYRVPNNVGDDYILEVAKQKYQAAKDLLDIVPGIAKVLASHLDSSFAQVTTDEIFTTIQTFEFKGEPLLIEALVALGSKDKSTTLYRVQIKVAPNQLAAFTFSSGFVFSGLVDQSFALEDGKVARRGSEDDLRPAVGVLAHWHPSKNGFAITAGVTGKDSDLQYLVGASWVSGWKQRFVATGGVAVGAVSRLDRVEVGDDFEEDTIPTRDVVRASAFVAVSFRFGG